jgi:hypothetical protein
MKRRKKYRRRNSGSSRKYSRQRQQRRLKNPDRLESAAIAVGKSRKKLRERLSYSKSVLKDGYRKLFRPGVFDFKKKRLVSNDGRYFLQWTVKGPDRDDQQTSRGTVILFEGKK